ncbi:hypothetical protein WH47_11187 [Habropoda laboriosa]|uniref:Uncharacterized protein n=1 Tax=Habropoda laboriosa TaxID=597456 RepID=A0A0L7RAJ8_9HYME|nr:hypothetical protein WH47_11187 [Habropoda laboriosa]
MHALFVPARHLTGHCSYVHQRDVGPPGGCRVPLRVPLANILTQISSEHVSGRDFI